MNKNYGNIIANARKENGLSQRRLAELSGIRNSTISRIEANKVTPDIETLEKISKVIDLELLDFVALPDDCTIRNAFIEMNAMIEHLSVEKQSVICDKMKRYLNEIMGKNNI